jgi:uncharacterized protein (DUF983 family)
MSHFLSDVPRLFGRALRLRCPNCGKGKLFASWLRMRPQCPVCGFRFERGEEGYQVGSYMFNIVASELAFAIVFVGLVAVTWPSPPWALLQYGGIIMMIIAPFVFFPFSRSLFLAFDLLFRPASREDLTRTGDDAPRLR